MLGPNLLTYGTNTITIQYKYMQYKYKCKYNTIQYNAIQYIYVIVKAPPCVCMTVQGGASRHSPSAVFFIHTSIGGALIVILYFLVVWLGTTFLSGQIAAIFAHQDVSECL